MPLTRSYVSNWAANTRSILSTLFTSTTTLLSTISQPEFAD
jgi:hypothetical protein